MMIRSLCLGLGRKIPAPNRSISKREAPVAIISIAQQAKPNVIGHRADFRAQLKTKSTLVVMMFFSNRSSIHAGIYDSVSNVIHQSGPVQRAFLDDPNVSNNQNTKKNHHLGEAEKRETTIDDGPREKENRLNVKNYKQDRDNVVPDGVALSGIGVRIDAAFIRHQFALAA